MKFEPMFIFAIFVFAVLCCSGTRPINIGIKNGKLAPCPDSPNCVSSQAEDDEHFIEPIPYAGDQRRAMKKMKSVITFMKRSKILEEQEKYLYAEFTSAIFRFVDDVEFIFNDEKKIIDVRSASRLGYGDMGVNRKRVERIRLLFSQNERNF